MVQRSGCEREGKRLKTNEGVSTTHRETGAKSSAEVRGPYNVVLAVPKARSAIRDEAQSFVSMKHKASWRSGPAARKERDWITRLNSLIDPIRVRLCRPRGRQRCKPFALKRVTTHLYSCRKSATLVAGARKSSGWAVLAERAVKESRGGANRRLVMDVTRCGAGEDDDRWRCWG